MEANEIPLELNSVLGLFHFEMMTASSSDNPLLCCVVTLYTLILVFYPHALRIFLSPVLILTALLLLLGLGACQRRRTPNAEENGIKDSNKIKRVLDRAKQVDKWVFSQAQIGCHSCPQKPDFEDSFVEWNVRAPLEVIYEAYEGEEDEDDPDYDPTQMLPNLERYPSLSMYYPDTDSDSSSDGGFLMTGGWDSPESGCFKWEEEDKEELIEIALHSNDKNYSGSGVHFEEDNLIEIDLSPSRPRS